MVWERWEAKPDTIILDIGESVLDFSNKMVDLAMLGELTKEDLITALITHIQDETTAHVSLDEFAWEIVSLFGGRQEKDVHEFVYAVKELGADIIDQLQEIVAYDDVGALWYDFSMMCGNDIVLKRSTLTNPLLPRTTT